MIGKIIDAKYQIAVFLGEGGMSTVWLAVELSTQRKVALKFLKKEITSSRLDDIIRFRNEATHVSKLDAPGTVKVYEIGEFEKQHYIAMEYLAGDSLQKWLEGGWSLGIDTAVEIIHQICVTLQRVHSAGVIHRNLNPGNIMIQESQIQGKAQVAVGITDFGLAQVRRFSAEESQAMLETLYYMAPEQSGAIKRGIDERSDLYSLGVIFYQLLGHVLPFTGTDLNSVIYKHIATVPQSLTQINPKVPPVLNKIVLKLLEKEPDHRYQSTEGLARDLENWRRGEVNFELGAYDLRKKLDYRTQLLGRERELELLKTKLSDAQKGQGSLCLVGGEAGTGKTRLVEEVRGWVEAQKGIYIDGKSFSGVHKIPYGPFIDALNTYLQEFARYPEAQKKAIRETVLAELGDLGGAVLKLNPMMEALIGECPPLVELESLKEINRFQMVISRLFAVLGQFHGVLVLMLDDLQWMDWGSCSLLTRMLSDIAGQQVMILGTYRDEAIPEDYSLIKLIKKAQEEQYPLTQIKLSPFDLDIMKQFVAKLLHESEARIREIAQLILAKSKGNPFFAIEILKQLIREHAISLHDDQLVIHYDILGNAQIPATIIDIILKRVGELEEPEIEVLSLAAVIGKKFDTVFLFELTALDQSQVLEILDKAIGMQLLEEDPAEKGKVLFVHDRIKEAFYRSIDPKHLKNLHLRIARLIEATALPESDTVTFDLAYHYVESQEIEKALEYLYPAGLKSQASWAHEAAAEYFKQSLAFLELMEKTGEPQWADCLQKLGEIDLLIGKSDTAIAYFDQVLPLRKAPQEKSRIYLRMSEAYFKLGDYRRCEQQARIGLALLGERLPIKQWAVVGGILKELGRHLLQVFFPVRHGTEHAPAAVEKYQLVIWYLYVLNWAYTLNDNLKLLGTTLKSLNVSERKIGKSKELGLSLMTYGGVCLAVGLFKRGFKYHMLALELRRALGDQWGVAQSLQFLSYYYLWNGAYDQCIAISRESAALFNKIGDFKEYNMALNAQFWGYSSQGDYPKAKVICDQFYENAFKAKDTYATCAANSFYVFYYLYTGDLAMAKFYGEAGYQLSLQAQDWFNHCAAGALLGNVYYVAGNTAQALHYLEQAKDLYDRNHFIKSLLAFIFASLAEVYIADYLANGYRLTGKERRQYRNKIKRLCQKAVAETMRWKVNHGAALAVQAGYFLMIGKVQLAEEYFGRSIRHCLKYHCKYDLARAHYEYGLLLKQQNRMNEAEKQWTQSYSLFKEMGSQHFQKKVAALLGIGETSPNSEQRLSQELQYSRRLSSIISLSRDISSILNMDLLLEKVINTAMEVSGAQNGYLLMRNQATEPLETLVQKTNGGRSVRSESVIGEVLAKGEAVLVSNAAEDERLASCQSVMENDLKSILCVPITYNEEIIGLCYLDNQLSSAVFTQEDIEVLNLVMTQAAISIENAKLYKLAIMDGLTDLVTRKHFMDLLEREMMRSRRYNRVFSLLMLDIDHFKKINDTYGHQAGDGVLVSLAKVAKTCFRNLDIVGRYGGEEFIAVLPETDGAGAVTVAKQLQAAVRNMEMEFKGKKLGVTISIGVATFPDHGVDLPMLIHAADTALYQSKHNGRDQITVYQTEPITASAQVPLPMK